MSNKDLVASARAMLTADDVDTKDMLAMVGELADAVESSCLPAIIFDGYKVFKEAEAECPGLQAHHVVHVLDVVARHAKAEAAQRQGGA